MPPTRSSGPRSQPGWITPERAARLYRILAALRAGSKTRDQLLKFLNIDIRGFYRDLEKLRELGVSVALIDHRYRLISSFDEAIATLPFPDPQLNLQEALVLAKGRSAAHRKLKSCLAAITGKR